MSTSADFDEVVRDYRGYIRTVAASQRLPGMDYDDVVSEMLHCLWKCHQTWDEELNPSFKNYWWRVWSNRRANILRDASRRIQPIYTDDYSSLEDLTAYDLEVLPEPPVGSSEQERALWFLIASGYQRKDIFALLRMSEWKYRNAMRKWRSHAVSLGVVYEA